MTIRIFVGWDNDGSNRQLSYEVWGIFDNLSPASIDNLKPELSNISNLEVFLNTLQHGDILDLKEGTFKLTVKKQSSKTSYELTPVSIEVPF